MKKALTSKHFLEKVVQCVENPSSFARAKVKFLHWASLTFGHFGRLWACSTR